MTVGDNNSEECYGDLSHLCSRCFSDHFSSSLVFHAAENWLDMSHDLKPVC